PDDGRRPGFPRNVEFPGYVVGCAPAVGQALALGDAGGQFAPKLRPRVLGQCGPGPRHGQHSDEDSSVSHSDYSRLRNDFEKETLVTLVDTKKIPSDKYCVRKASMEGCVSWGFPQELGKTRGACPVGSQFPLNS